MIYKSQILSSFNFIKHGFFGRKGGVSSSYYGSLNISYSSGDLAENVRKNRNIIENKLNLTSDSLNFCHQVHSNKALVIENKIDQNNLPQYDALITKKQNLPLAITTADCAPLLLVDSKQKIVAGIHAGWKGALHGVVINTINEMIALGCNTKDISACIGPCIAQESYEVDEEFYKNFLNQTQANKDFFIKTDNEKYLFSLASYLLNQLKLLKLKNCENLGLNTFALAESFFSHRRMTLNKEPQKGLQCCVISICNH